MGFDINTLKSHPDKLLLEHIQGVRENTKKLTNSRIAELVAIFHDLGKINPNFQNKLKSHIRDGYSNHSYLSAYAFFCAFWCSLDNGRKILQNFLSVDSLCQNDMIALIVLIAKHHSDLPDFLPKTHGTILLKDEVITLFNFLEKEQNMPIWEYVNYFQEVEDFRTNLTNKKIQYVFLNKLNFDVKGNDKALEFFLDNQFAFASVLQADKADAGKMGNIIDNQLENIQKFSSILAHYLESYQSKLKQDTDINQLRTTIRNHAVQNIKEELSKGEQVFELTAPTGSGKTLMLLSLASEIIKAKGAKRIIYALPFLSITEQIETEILKIFKGYEDYIQRIDSKSENIKYKTLQKELDNDITEGKILEMSILEFQENIFAYPLVITTFVRFFETLLSNKNADLLKLPNFSNCIFLLDEIQTLPPRLYGFFVAYIKKFCQKFNSYAIISTATQPNFKLPEKNEQAKDFFYDYTIPKPLLPLCYFNNELFNRYQIEFNSKSIDLDILKQQIVLENSSILVILNTIDDTKDLFKKLRQDYDSKELFLLNTHFTPRHRKLKIYLAKRRLRQSKRIIVVSTQLIEAGVDIDFPVLYRDFTTVASIVQSAGRCNRNGKLPIKGKVVLFRLEKNGKIRSELIYRGKDNEILIFTEKLFASPKYQEKGLLAIQQGFFNEVQSELIFAKHWQNSPEIEFDFLKDIKECMFEKIGKFQLIDKQHFGEECQYFVPAKENDFRFEELLVLQKELVELLNKKSDIALIKYKKKLIELKLKNMSNYIIQIRLKTNNIKPLLSNEENYFSLYKIDSKCYSFENGIDLGGNECLL